MSISKSPLNKLLLVKETLVQHIQSDTSSDAQVLGEWYAISTLVHKFYRTSFVHNHQREDFEKTFHSLEDNVSRADLLLNQRKFVKKVKRYVSSIISEASLIKCRQALRFSSLLRSRSKGHPLEHESEEEEKDIEAMDSEELRQYKHVIFSEKLETFQELDTMPGISNKLRLNLFPPKRRGYMALEDLEPDEILAVQRPLAVWMSPQFYDSYCSQCYNKLSAEYVSCASCKVNRFCNRRCFQKAKELFHDKECNFMPILKHLSVAHFVIRLMIVVGLNRFIELELEKDGVVRFESGGDRSKRFVDLDDSVKNVPAEDILSFTCTAVFICFLANKMFIFPEKPSHRILTASCVNALVTAARNLYTVYDHSFKPRLVSFEDSRDKVKALVEGKSKEIGYGLYFTTSLFNHSCTPDAYAVFLGDHIVIVLQRKVAGGQEVTISYGTTYPTSKFSDRQRKLMENFYFTCICQQCQKGEELEAEELAELMAKKEKDQSPRGAREDRKKKRKKKNDQQPALEKIVSETARP